MLGNQCHAGSVESRQIRGKDLVRGTRLTKRRAGAVQSTAGCLFSTAAADGLDLSCRLIHHNKGNLWLDDKINLFAFHLASGAF